jgi:cellulose synthase/poly-beta-1,6-N-acetylglucosamine synthase-like glycosyltransferase
VNFPQALLLATYYAMLAVVTAVMVYRGLLVLRFYRRPRADETPRQRFPEPPVVTVQLPIFNERFVVERLLESVCRLDWPRDRLEVQLLDDSTDETVAIAGAKVRELRARGFDVKHLHRTDRTGYKAGALREATHLARGDYLAVFDADFVPDPDFLKKTMDFFTDPSVGFVQTRWTYLNRDYGILTQGMGMLLDGHFVLEQVTRSRGGYIFNFNGTGGVWRRQAIGDAGGWHDDTICEDTDLSYRAHLAGYRGVFLREVPCPSELPVQVTALKSQQHRWAKGLTECFLKLMPVLWRSDLPLKKKLEGTFHLGGNLAFPASIVMTLVTLPVLLMRMQGHGVGGVSMAVDTVVFVLFVVTQLVFYMVATREVHTNWWERLRFLPFFPIVGVGLAVNNARGVLEALLGHRTAFVRTPKLGVLGRDRGVAAERSRTYFSAREVVQPLLELAFGAYYLRMSLIQVRYGFLVSAVVTAALSGGLFVMGGATVRSLLASRRRRAEDALPAPTLAPAE